VSGRWETVCVVGVGGHARNRLIPAILANGQRLGGLVSRKPAGELPAAPLFATLEEAIDTLPPDTLFLLASPPSAHAGQALQALRAGRDVLVEKPAFLTAAEAKEAAIAARKSNAILAEGFMHRHTEFYQRFLSAWRSRPPGARLAVEFIIPALPENTFRQTDPLALTCLYDIGSYVMSLLADLHLPLDDLGLTNQGEVLNFRGRWGETDVSARIGIGPYENSVTIHASGAAFRYAPFFYGRAGDRTISTARGTEEMRETFPTPDAFRAMLGVPRPAWLESQERRLAQLQATAGALERLAGELRNG
jgi:predicted dehydrogenase